MNRVMQSVARVLRGALDAWKRYPGSLGFAVAFVIVTMIRIQLDWQQQEPYDFLFNCLHWSFALGAVFSLACVAFASSRGGGKKSLVAANLSGFVAAAAAFVLLYLFSGYTPAGSQYPVISSAARLRVGGLILIGLILFVMVAGYRGGRYEFDKSLFMAEKSFFLSAIYALALLLGAFGVAIAVEALIYSEMSEKVFLYIGTFAGLIGYMLFVGYFPDFAAGEDDPKRESAERQPRFIEILFSYILVPIVLALTLVLLIWAVRSIVTGMHVRFLQLYSIAAAYTLGGLWLHAMIAYSTSAPAKLYRAVYPFASIVILVFEGWAVVSRLIESGLKNTEYIFVLLGLLALFGIVSLLIKKERAHSYIAIAACFLALLAILPGVGYKNLPVSAQAARLERLLVSQDMLRDGAIVPASAEPEEPVKIAVTDAVYYLLNEREATLPAWFDTDRIDRMQFDNVFGFEQTWSQPEEESTGYRDYRGVYIMRGGEAMEVGSYDWAVEFRGLTDPDAPIVFTGKNGTYAVSLAGGQENSPPVLRITLDGAAVVEQSMEAYFDELAARYGLESSGEHIGSLEEMRIAIEAEPFNALLILDFADFSLDPSSGQTYYYVEPHVLYLKEK